MAEKKKADGTVKLDVKASKPPARTPAKAKAPSTTVVGAANAVVAGETIKKGVLLDDVVQRSGVKRGDAKTVVEATCAALAEYLLRGDEVNLPPLGKLKVVKDKPLSEGAHALTLKLRTMKTATGSEG